MLLCQNKHHELNWPHRDDANYISLRDVSTYSEAADKTIVSQN